jgi:hypothetical protein
LVLRAESWHIIPVPAVGHSGMANLENRVPTQHDAITVAGRTGRFLVIGIDPLTKTVEVRTTSASFSASFVVVKDVPWTTISYLD